VVVGDDATPPLPDALLRLQLGRVGGLGPELEPASRATAEGFYGSPLRLLSAVMDHPQAFRRRVGQQARPEGRTLALPHRGADMVVGPPRQRGDGPIDLPPGRLSPRGHCGHVGDQAPRRGQRRMAASGRCIHTEQGTVRGPLRQQRCQVGHDGGLCLRVGLQVVRAQPPPANPQGVQQLPHPFPALLDTATGREVVPDPWGGPPTGVIAHGPGALAHRLLERRALRGRESSGGAPDAPSAPALAAWPR
jgi:hypothetical protein